jgi:hypothetical protein
MQSHWVAWLHAVSQHVSIDGMLRQEAQAIRILALEVCWTGGNLNRSALPA